MSMPDEFDLLLLEHERELWGETARCRWPRCACRVPPIAYCRFMHIAHFNDLDALVPLASAWDRLAQGVPFRSWAWMSTWWRHYGLKRPGRGSKAELYVLVAFDPPGVPVGIAPWYRERSVARGRVLRFLGLGEVCGEYLTVLCAPQRESAVAQAVAQWLTERNRRPRRGAARDDSLAWDLLEMTAVAAQDAAVTRLAEAMEHCGNGVHCRAGAPCWRIDLPDRWDTFLAMLSKDHRKQVRRMASRLVSTGRASVHWVDRLADLPRAEAILIDLHQRRWCSVGKPGCFASERFTAFHRDLMPQLLTNGQLALGWIELDGRPVVAEYHFVGGGVVYAYQSGMEPDAREFSPGSLGNLVAIRRAIEQGCHAFDFLRGDEPYKAHWRARTEATVEVRVVAARPAAQLRHRLWRAGSRLKRWSKERRGR